MAHAQQAAVAGHADHGHHITPQSLLIKVFVALIVLTVVTVITSRLDLGGLNVPLAMLIASVKAMLVVVVFMALKWDNRVNALVIGMSVVFVAIFLVFTLFDTAFRGDLSNVDSQTIMDAERMQTGEAAAPAAAH